MANSQLLGCSQFDYPGNDIKSSAQDKMTYKSCRPWAKKWSCLSKNDSCHNMPGSSYTVLFYFLENAFGHAFLSTHFTESLACVDYGPVSSAAAQISWRGQSRCGYSRAPDRAMERQVNEGMKDPILEERSAWRLHFEILRLRFHFYISILGYFAKSPGVYFNISATCTYSL